MGKQRRMQSDNVCWVWFGLGCQGCQPLHGRSACLLCANKQSTTWLGRTLKITSSWFSGTQLVIAARGCRRVGGGRTHSALCAFCGAYFQAQRNFIDNPKCCCSFNVCVRVCECVWCVHSRFVHCSHISTANQTHASLKSGRPPAQGRARIGASASAYDGGRRWLN